MRKKTRNPIGYHSPNQYKVVQEILEASQTQEQTPKHSKEQDLKGNKVDEQILFKLDALHRVVLDELVIQENEKIASTNEMMWDACVQVIEAKESGERSASVANNVLWDNVQKRGMYWYYVINEINHSIKIPNDFTHTTRYWLQPAESQSSYLRTLIIKEATKCDYDKGETYNDTLLFSLLVQGNIVDNGQGWFDVPAGSVKETPKAKTQFRKI